MVVNLSARKLELLIDGVDFSSHLKTFEGKDDHLLKGLISFSGKLILKHIPYTEMWNEEDEEWVYVPGESLDDRKNPRFCRGKPVIASYADTAGTLRRHPKGATRILKSFYNDKSKELEIEIGDLITLLNFKEATDPDKADNKSSEGKTAAQVITSLLAQAGITSIGGNLPTTRYNYPLDISGSYLEAVGTILYANNCFGFIDENEIFQIRRADIAGGGAGIFIEIGENEVFYTRLDGAEAPVEKVKAVGNEITVSPREDESTSVTEITGSSAAVFGSSSGFMGQSVTDMVVERTERTETVSDAERKVVTKTQKPYGLTIPSIWWDATPRSEMIPAEESETTWKYESSPEGKLLTKTEKLYATRATYLAELKGEFQDTIFSNIYGLVLTKQITENYFYEKEIINKIVTETKEINIAILNATEEEWTNGIPEEYPVTSELKTEAWAELSPGEWEYTVLTLRPVVRVDRTLVVTNSTTGDSNKLELMKYFSDRRLSNCGQENPPATERAPTKCNIEEKQVEEFQTFIDTCASALKPRERTFSVDMLPGKLKGTTGEAKQCLQQIAIREGRLLKGREKGQEIATNLRDILFDYEPLMPVYCRELDGTIQNFLADGCSWVFSPNRALWSCDGIWVGTLAESVEIEDGIAPGIDVIPIYSEPINIGFGFGFGLDSTTYNYPPNKEAVAAGFGIGIGSNPYPTLPLITAQFGIGVGFEPLSDDRITARFGIGVGFEPRLIPAIITEFGFGINTDPVAVINAGFGLGVGHDAQRDLSQIDPLFAFVPLLLKGNNIVASSTIINSGNISYSVSFENTNVLNSDSFPKFGEGALQFNPDNASGLLCSSAAFNVGSQNCTIECWFRATGDISTNKIIFDMRPDSNGAFPIFAIRENLITIGWNATDPIIASVSLSHNNYYYAALRKIRKNIGLPTERQDTELWFMGNKVGEFNSGSWGSPGRILIGKLAFDGFAPQTRFRGQMDEFRFTLEARDVSTIPANPFPTS